MTRAQALKVLNGCGQKAVNRVGGVNRLRVQKSCGDIEASGRRTRRNIFLH